MLYVKIVDGKAVKAVADDAFRAECNGDYARALSEGWQCRCDWKTYEEAVAIAVSLTSASGGERLYLGTDAGSHVSPQYDVVEAPKVGDAASYAFNGDSYPCGEVVRVSAAPACRVVTTRDADGVERRFYRRRQSGAWIYDGTWSLVRGHVSSYNRSL